MLIGLVVAVGLLLGIWKITASLYDKPGASVQDLSQATTAKGPLKRFAKGAMAKLITHETPIAVTDIEFYDAAHRPVHLSSFKGHVVLVNVWATWCAPCRMEMPTLSHLQSDYADKGLKVIAISTDPEDKYAEAKSFMDVNAPLDLYLDPNFAAPTKFGIQGMPTTLILDKQGREVARLSGEASWDRPEVKALIDELNQ